MEWEKKGHEEKQLDNYLSGVGKATGILGDTRISNNCLLITDIFPSCLFLVTSVWVLSVGPLHRPSWRGLQGGPCSIPVILACRKESEKSALAACSGPGAWVAQPGSRCRILLEPEPKHSSAPHELLYSVKHEKSPYTTPPAPQNLSFAAQLWTSSGKSHSAGDPREAHSPGTPAERRFG